MADMHYAGNYAGYFIGIVPSERRSERPINLLFLDLWSCARLRANHQRRKPVHDLSGKSVWITGAGSGMTVGAAVTTMTMTIITRERGGSG